MLSIRVQFLAGYSGKEWPPSPARVFKALVSASRGGWAVRRRHEFNEILRSIESQPASPIIAAPLVRRYDPGRVRFVPNNSENWPTQRRINPQKGIDLDEERIWRWEPAPPGAVWYVWPDIASNVLNAVRELARRVPSVGKGEDIAIVDATECSHPSSLTIWRPAPGTEEPRLEVPDVGCLDVCDANFRRGADELPLAIAGTRVVRYSDGREDEPRVPVVVFMLGKGKRSRSWDPRLLRQVVGPVRRALDEVRMEIVDELARDSADRSQVDALARRVLLGHSELGDRARHPHLAVLPIPSVFPPYPDGRIRRVALLGFGCMADPERAIFELAHILLHGRELRHEGVGTGVTLQIDEDGKWRDAISARSRSWVSVTPVIQPAAELTKADWHRLRAARREPEKVHELVRFEQRLHRRRVQVVRHAIAYALGRSDALSAEIEIVRGGTLTGVYPSSNYRVADYLAETPRVHVRIRFARPIAGPIVLGRGRYVGLGLLWPEHDSR